MTQAANTLIQGLNKAGVQTALKEFGKSMKSMETTSKLGGFTEFNQGLELLDKLQGHLLNTPMRVFLAQITAGTTEAAVELMTAMLELLNSDTAQESIKVLSGFISGIFNTAGVVVDNLNLALNDSSEASERLEDALSGHLMVVDGLVVSLKEYNRLIAEQEEALRLANINLGRFNNTLNNIGGGTTTPGFQEFG